MTRTIESLIPLQQIDRKIHEIKQKIDAKPRELATIQYDLDQAREAIEKTKEEIKQLKLEASKKELEIKEKDDQINKLQNQALMARKNEEYQAIQKQISGINVDKSLIEDRLLEIYMKIDDITKRQVEKEEVLQSVTQLYNQEKSRIDQETDELKKILASFESERNQLISGINMDLLQQYERILLSKSDDGVALAKAIRRNIVTGQKTVKDEFLQHTYSCEGCSVELTSQDVNLLLLGKKILLCRNCSRILYLPVSQQTGLQEEPKEQSN